MDKLYPLIFDFYIKEQCANSELLRSFAHIHCRTKSLHKQLSGSELLIYEAAYSEGKLDMREEMLENLKYIIDTYKSNHN